MCATTAARNEREFAVITADDIKNLARITKRPVMENKRGLLLNSPMCRHRTTAITLWHIIAKAHQVLVAVRPVIFHFDPKFEMHWFAELFSNFRFYFLLTQALLVLIFLHSQRWVLMTLTVLLAIPNGWYVMPYLTPFVLSSSVAAGNP